MKSIIATVADVVAIGLTFLLFKSQYEVPNIEESDVGGIILLVGIYLGLIVGGTIGGLISPPDRFLLVIPPAIVILIFSMNLEVSAGLAGVVSALLVLTPIFVLMIAFHLIPLFFVNWIMEKAGRDNSVNASHA